MRSIEYISRVEDTNFSWNLRGKLFTFDQVRILGIVNLTPDSFWEDSRANTQIEIEKQVEKQISEGADIIDFGAYSSRPNAAEVSEKEEIERLHNGLPLIKRYPNTFWSIDTFRSEVAHIALNEGMHIVNDISAGIEDENMFKTVAGFQAAMILMHRLGNIKNMHTVFEEDKLIPKMHHYFSQQMKDARENGVNDLAIDLGYGFSKSMHQNFNLLKRQKEFLIHGAPILSGISRKSMIYKRLDISPQQALNGTTALHAQAILNGAKLLRVHDVKEAKQVIQLLSF